MKKCRVYVALFVLLGATEILWASSNLSQYGGSASSILEVLNRVLSIMTGSIARTIAAIAVVGAGYMAFIGRLSFQAMINIVLGIGLIFGAGGIAQSLIG